MELSEHVQNNIQLSNVFSDDYKYFESNHAIHPTDAATVFGCVADLRAALQAFREAAQRSSKDIVIERTESSLAEHPSDIAEPALLASVDGSVDTGVAGSL